MITGARQSPRQIVSPRQSHKRPLNSNAISSVQREYQMRSNRLPIKQQDKLNKRIQRQNSKDREQSFKRRKLSFKSNDGEPYQSYRELQAKNIIPVKKLSVKENRHPTSQQLAIQIQYHQFNLPPKNLMAPESSSNKKQEFFKRRIHRIKSSDNFSLAKNTEANNNQIQIKIQLAQQENSELKRMRSETLLKLQTLEKIYTEEKANFKGETISYQRKIEALTRKIQSNRNQLGHIYSYPAFDPVKLMVKPIVELEGESSQMRSLIKTSELPHFEELQYQSRMVKINQGEIEGKQQMTQRTGPSSRQQYGEIDYF